MSLSERRTSKAAKVGNHGRIPFWVAFSLFSWQWLFLALSISFLPIFQQIVWIAKLQQHVQDLHATRISHRELPTRSTKGCFRVPDPLRCPYSVRVLCVIRIIRRGAWTRTSKTRPSLRTLLRTPALITRSALRKMGRLLTTPGILLVGALFPSFKCMICLIRQFSAHIPPDY